MRYVVVGPGGIGSTLGGRLRQAGRDVVLVARGSHLDALRTSGLRLVSPVGADLIAVDVVGDAAETTFDADTVVVLAMKSNDAAAAIHRLADIASPDTTIVCTQNGVETERLASRYFRHVYGAYNFLIVSYLTPGTAHIHTTPSSGAIDVGRFPFGLDDRADEIVADLRLAGFDAVGRTDVMAWKYTKLLANLTNALNAACGPLTDLTDVVAALQQEGRDCYAAAGIGYVTQAEEEARRAHLLPPRPAGGVPFAGGSSWQSLARGTGRIETDYLNGEISLLGRLHGVPTPVNDAVRVLANDLARSGRSPGALPAAHVRQILGFAPAGPA